MTAAEVNAHVQLIKPQEKNVIVVYIKDEAKSEELVLAFNPNRVEANVHVPDGCWNILVKDEQAGVDSLGKVQGDKVILAPISAMVLEKCAK